MKTLARYGMRQDCEQRFREFFVIICKILRQLPGGSVQGHAIARGQSPEEPCRRITDERRVAHREVHIVEDHGHKALRQNNSPAPRNIRA